MSGRGKGGKVKGKSKSRSARAGLQCLASLYSASLIVGYLPQSWKLSVVSMIPKPNKNRSDPTNYRPISLTSVICKTLERILTPRIRNFCDKFIPQHQSGFLPNRGTGDNLHRISQHLFENLRTGHQKPLLVSFDVEKAFDTVWHQGLIYKLHSYDLPPHFLRWINAFISNRNIPMSKLTTKIPN